jgi:hypothetical protein
MMPVSFAGIRTGSSYSRHTLAKLWGFSSFHAIARGVVTPKRDRKIILFVTEAKQSSLVQYKDQLDGNLLRWEGPTDHYAEERLLRASTSGDEIHLFHRMRHHSDFTYHGQLRLTAHLLRSTSPSYFEFEVI